MTPQEWSLHALELLNFEQSESELTFPNREALKFPSMHDLIAAEIRKPIDQVRPLAEMEAERREELESGGLATTDLNSKVGKDSKIALLIKNRTPNMNGTREKTFQPFTKGSEIIVTIELHSPRHPWTSSTVHGAAMLKSLQSMLTRTRTVQVRGDATVQDLRLALANQPVNLNYDGPHYRLGGLITLGKSVFRDTFGMDEPEWCDYAAQNVKFFADGGYTLRDMPDVKLADIPELVELAQSRKAGFYQHCGDEVNLLFVTNISLGNETTPLVEEVYTRSCRKLAWCSLCGVRGANLSVLDDDWLPETPCFCCKECYRQLRTDTNGDFIEPAGVVQIYPFTDH